MDSQVGFKGTYKFTQKRSGVTVCSWEDSNIVPLEGLNHILNLINGTDVGLSWFIGLGTGNYTVASTDTGANIPTAGRANETTNYTALTRPAATLAASTAASTTNAASVAVFTFNLDTTITNAFVVSTDVKGGVVQTALSSLKLATARPMLSGDDLEVTFTLTAASV